MRQLIARELRGNGWHGPRWPSVRHGQPTAYRKTVRGVLDGFATFWNIRLDG